MLIVLPLNLLAAAASVGTRGASAPSWEFVFKNIMGIDYEVDLGSVRRTGSTLTVRVRAHGGNDPGFWNGSDSYETFERIDCAKRSVTPLRTLFKNGNKVVLTKPQQRSNVAGKDTADSAIVDAVCGSGNRLSSRMAIPSPQLHFAGSETFERSGQSFVRYKLDVANAASYPADLFKPSPDLPPCGKNASSSRTWVDIFDDAGTRLYGFCALRQPQDLDGLWFALPKGSSPPSAVYIELTDRKVGKSYRSNVAAVPQAPR